MLLAALLLAAAAVTPPPHAGAEATDPAVTAPLIKQGQRHALMQKFTRKRARAIERIRRDREAIQAGLTPEAARASGSRPSRDQLEPGGPQGSDARLREHRQARAAQVMGGFTPPANVIVNDRSTDVASDGQAEQDVAAHGNNILVAWNDGRGFSDGTGDTQGWGYSTDGGQTFIDGGKLPKPPASPTFVWTSDPLIAVNQNTGEFWYLGLCAPTSVTNGVAIIRGTFSGGGFTWNTPVLIRSVSNSNTFLDKPWLVADSSNGNLYLTYTEFFVGGNEINFRRSTNGGANWSADIKLSDPADDGFVQGSRAVVGPTGQVYAFWYVIGAVDEDFMVLRTSTNAGASFGATQHTATGFFANFGTGAPGFNRDIGIEFPSVSVDRVVGSPNLGRIYLTWNETVNWYNDAFPVPGLTETENNNTSAQADAFSPGQRLRGTLVGSDLDWFSFSATQGQTYVFWCDSLPDTQAPNPLDYTMRIICSDGTTLLALSGALSLGGLDGYIVWTAPTTGTYYFRMGSLDASENGGYRVLTTVNGTPDVRERARDQRDVFVTSSINGGANWTTPTRVNSDAGHFDNWLPEVEVGYAVDAARPYVIWYDWRDDATCGGSSHVYLARSDDVGSTWTELGAITTQETDWSATSSNIAPNQGDYLALYADATNLYACWADGRNSDPDVFSSVIPLASTPVLVSLASASAAPGRVTLSWYSGGDAIASATVERRRDPGDWQSIGTIVPDGNHRLTFEDTDVVPGARYGYRLAIGEGAERRFVGEAWVEVPSGAKLAIIGVQPNPAAGDAWISFALPGSERAAIDVLDVSGRVVREIDLGAPGPGNHRWNLSAGGRLAPGVYIVRLDYGGRSTTTRWSVVR
jgi:hypothetical protein